MLNLLLVALLACTCFSKPLYSPRDYLAIKQLAKTWTPSIYNLADSKEAHRGRLMPSFANDIEAMKYPTTSPSPNAHYPESFDAREQWPGCIGAIRDQGSCGSCWAFGLTEVLADRECIFYGMDTPNVYSPEWMINCNFLQLGCNGGSLAIAWEFAVVEGVIPDACEPYTSGYDGEVHSCPDECVDGSPLPEPTKVAGYDIITKSVAGIQDALMTLGPVEVSFSVYDDFDYYDHGVYQHVWGSFGGLHAVKIIGWGVDNGVDYWLVANSWGSNWGESGFFRILRGVDECGIEANPIAGYFE